MEIIDIQKIHLSFWEGVCLAKKASGQSPQTAQQSQKCLAKKKYSHLRRCAIWWNSATTIFSVLDTVRLKEKRDILPSIYPGWFLVQNECLKMVYLIVAG